MIGISRCTCLAVALRAAATLPLMTCGDSTWTARSGYDHSLQVHTHTRTQALRFTVTLLLKCPTHIHTLLVTITTRVSHPRLSERCFGLLCVQARTRLLKPEPHWWCLRTCWCCSGAGPAPAPTLCTSPSASSMRSTPTLLPKTGEIHHHLHLQRVASSHIMQQHCSVPGSHLLLMC